MLANLFVDRDHLAQYLQQLDAELVLLFIPQVLRVIDDSVIGNERRRNGVRSNVGLVVCGYCVE